MQISQLEELKMSNK